MKPMPISTFDRQVDRSMNLGILPSLSSSGPHAPADKPAWCRPRHRAYFPYTIAMGVGILGSLFFPARILSLYLTNQVNSPPPRTFLRAGSVEFLVSVVLLNLQTPDLLLGHYSRRDAAILSMDLNRHNTLWKPDKPSDKPGTWGSKEGKWGGQGMFYSWQS